MINNEQRQLQARKRRRVQTTRRESKPPSDTALYYFCLHKYSFPLAIQTAAANKTATLCISGSKNKMQDPMKKRSLEDMRNEKAAANGADSMEIDSTDVLQRRDLMTLLSRPSPFANESGALPIGEFEPLSIKSPHITTSDLVESPLTQAKVLVVGAGGLGCEILKNLALSGISNVHVIDLDSIDITNCECCDIVLRSVPISVCIENATF